MLILWIRLAWSCILPSSIVDEQYSAVLVPHKGVRTTGTTETLAPIILKSREREYVVAPPPKKKIKYMPSLSAGYTQFCIAGDLCWRTQNAQKLLAARAFTRTQLGSLQCSPKLPCWLVPPLPSTPPRLSPFSFKFALLISLWHHWCHVWELGLKM